MKVGTNLNPIEKIGEQGGEESEFTVTSNAQAFEILSAGIYTDPIAAVVRESSCNAYDAMVDADKADIPFRIHLPTKLSPHFAVIDDGIGLSDKDIRGLYSSYFQSTKSNDNTKIGAFGLGSKSPFSYSKSFIVKSRFDGDERTYAIYINEKGVPTMEEKACIPTTECNGIEVHISVRSQDYDTFAERTADILQYFPVKPIVSGKSGFEFPVPSSSATIESTYIVDKEDSGLVAVQGNVPYKVDGYQMSSALTSQCDRFRRKHGITLFFDIGMLDVAASREEVRYDERTVKNIADALQTAFDDYLVQLDNKLTELTKSGSVWEIYTILREKFNSKSNLESLVGTNYKFTSDMANTWMEDDKLEYSLTWQYHKIIPYKHGEVRAVRGHHDFEGTGSARTYHIRPDVNTQLVLQDVTKRGSMRMNTKLCASCTNGIKVIMAIIPHTDRALAKDGVTATSQERQTELDLIMEQFGNPTIETLSTWTVDVAAATRATRASGHTFKTIIEPTRRNKNNNPHFIETAEPTDGGLYIEIDLLRNTIIKGAKRGLGAQSLIDMLTPVLNVINVAKGTHYTPTDVFGLTKKVVKYVSNDTNWMTVEDAYKEAIVQQMGVIEYYKRIGSSTVLGLDRYIAKSSFVSMVKSLDSKSAFRTLVEPVIDMSKEALALSNLSLYSVDRDDFRRGLVEFEQVHDIKHQVNTTSFFDTADFTKYPMLKHIDFDYTQDRSDAHQYIELVESV